MTFIGDTVLFIDLIHVYYIICNIICWTFLSRLGINIIRIQQQYLFVMSDTIYRSSTLWAGLLSHATVLILWERD